MSHSKPPSVAGSPARTLPPSLEVYLLGTVALDAAVALMDWLAFDLSERSDGRGVLLLCECPVAVSLGAEGSRRDLAAPAIDGEVPVVWQPRGGGAFVQGPGLLMVVPMIPLSQRKIPLGEVTPRLASALASACESLKVPARIGKTAPSSDGDAVYGRGGRLAAVGSAVRHGVTTYGGVLSVCPDPALPRMAVKEQWSSLAAQRAKPDLMHAARQAVLHAIAEVFSYERFHVHTSHEMLRRPKVLDRVMVST